MPEHLTGQLVLALEVVVERRLRHTHFPQGTIELHGVDAVGVEKVGSPNQNFLADPGGRLAVSKQPSSGLSGGSIAQGLAAVVAELYHKSTLG